MWEFELSHASFHSSVRSDDEDGERCAVQEGAKEKRLGSLAICLLAPPPPAAERTCDLEAKQIIIITRKKRKQKILVRCKCPNSVRLESIVEKEEKPTH